MKPNTQWIGEKIHTFFGETVTPIANQTQFVRRASRLDGLMFLKALVFGFIERPNASLFENHPPKWRVINYARI
jgi:hypothetical protein